jgi:hypothetical protein
MLSIDYLHLTGGSTNFAPQLQLRAVVARAMRVVARVARGSALWHGRPRGLATAAVCTKLGAPLELQHDWRLPPLGPTEVRVRIAAAGINYADLLQAPDC